MLRFRINRATYWLAVAFVIAIMAALAYIEKLSGHLEWAMLVIGVPRLHDIGKSGWIIGGVIALMSVGTIAPAMAGLGVDAVLVVAGLFVIVVAALGVWLGLVPGQPHENRWGPPPPSGLQWRRTPNPSR